MPFPYTIPIFFGTDMSTRSSIRQAVSPRLGLYVSGTTDATGGSTTTVVDTDSDVTNSYISAQKFVGSWVLLTSGTDSGLERQITTYVNTGTLTVGRAWSGATVAQSVTFEVHSILSATRINECIDRALRRMTYETLFFPTLVTDGDMETSGVGSWTASNSAALTKSTTAAYVLYGTQSLRVANAEATGGAISTYVEVYPNTTYIVQAYVKVASGTARLRAFDRTNTVAIDSVTSTEAPWSRMQLTFTTPSTCQSLSIDLMGDEATADVYWNKVLLFEHADLRHLLPSYYSYPYQVREVYQLWDTQAATTSNGVYKVGKPSYVRVDGWALETDPVANATDSIILPLTPSGSWVPVIKMLRTHAALSADTTTTAAPDEWVEAEVAIEILKEKIKEVSGADKKNWQIELAKWGRIARGLRDIYVPKYPEPVGL